MAFWDVRKPEKPTGIKDPDAILDYSIDYSPWLTDIADAYASHTVLVTGGLVAQSSIESAGVITVWLSGGVVDTTASFTVRITTLQGRVDDRTFYLKIKDR